MRVPPSAHLRPKMTASQAAVNSSLSTTGHQCAALKPHAVRQFILYGLPSGLIVTKEWCPPRNEEVSKITSFLSKGLKVQKRTAIHGSNVQHTSVEIH